jgi:predicted TIM-barrel fold metal-dependent hydrolase
MIIDFHYHFYFQKLKESDALKRAQDQVSIWYRSAGIRLAKPLGEMAKDRMDITYDPDGTKLLQRMEEAGIDLTVIFANDANLKTPEAEIMGAQRACAELSRRNANKLIAFASIHPNRKNGPDLFKECVREYGMRGLKWHPANGLFDPISPDAYRILQVAQELKVPIVTHTGSIYGSGNGKFSHPMLLDQIASDFPELKIMAAHMGHILWHDWCEVAYFKRNVYGDLAEWQIFAVGQYQWFCRTLREMIDLVGVDRIMFATDGPYMELVVSNAKWVKIIKDLPKDAPKGIKFTEEEVSAMLGGNAKHLLGI